MKIQNTNNRGQSLVVLMVVVVISAIILGSGAQFIALRIKTREAAKQRIIGSRLVQEALEATRAITYEDWHNIDERILGTEYYLNNSEGKWVLTTNIDDKTPLEDKKYERWITFHKVSRNADENIESDYVPENDDPSTRKITVNVKHIVSNREFSMDYYLTLWKQYTITFATNPISTGTITFGNADFADYSNGDETYKAAGTYNIIANPGAGYSFDSWEVIAGSISVNDINSKSTTCTISGDGTLQMNQVD